MQKCNCIFILKLRVLVFVILAPPPADEESPILYIKIYFVALLFAYIKFLL